MVEKMRARHEVFGVKDVPDNAFYRATGWEPVDPSTPTTEQDRRRLENAIRSGDYDPAEHKATEVVAVLENAPEDVKAEVVAAEKSGKARKTVLNAE